MIYQIYRNWGQAKMSVDVKSELLAYCIRSVSKPIEFSSVFCERELVLEAQMRDGTCLSEERPCGHEQDQT